MNNNKTYTFKPMNFNDYGYDFFDNMNYSNYYANPHQRTNSDCPCNTPPPQKPCPPQRPCQSCPPQNNFPPFIPPQRPCPPCVNPMPPPIQDCSKDNFRYFLIGYLFGSKD